jgi:hypothetical protein
MDHLIVACSCGLDPATETMALQSGIALALAAPIWFREQIAHGIRRLLGQELPPPSEACEDNSGE